ncbi:hypothetical protein JTB14_008294 [Gonioctena quinquepunctata]|nr:hypothetical protein JTB14_008294 [Gonioctena quinquepunctata]
MNVSNKSLNIFGVVGLRSTSVIFNSVLNGGKTTWTFSRLDPWLLCSSSTLALRKDTGAASRLRWSYSSGMDPKRFYNSFQFVNNIPGDGNSSEDDIASDSDSDYSPPLRYVSRNKNIEVISETDSETGDDIPSTSSSTKKPKRKSVKNNNLQEESKSKQSMPKKDKIIWTEKKEGV